MITVSDKEAELLRVILRDFKLRTQGDDGRLMLSNNSHINMAEWENLMRKLRNISEESSYMVTGIDLHKKRFTYSSTSLANVNCINAYQGTVWECLPDGTRKVIRRIRNY